MAKKKVRGETRRRVARAFTVMSAVMSAGTIVAMASSARSQDFPTPPPIDVPTNPVPQVNTPYSSATTKQGQKQPPPPPPTTFSGTSSGGSSPTPASSSSAGGGSFNNEGVFKISGTKGPGVVGTGKPTQPQAIAGNPSKPGKFVAANKKAPPVVAQWPGFRMTDDGGSEVMVEFSKSLGAPVEHKTAGTLVYVFKDAHVSKSNNQNPLLTIHFNTPVMSARLVPHKGGELHLVVEMRPGVDVAPVTGQRVATDNIGQQFFLKFPSGNYLPASDDDLGIKPTALTEEGLKSKKSKSTPAPTSSGKSSNPSGVGPKP